MLASRQDARRSAVSSRVRCLLQCLPSDVGGAHAALWLTSWAGVAAAAAAAAALDPLTARHHIRGGEHYLNSLQSEIEFRASISIPSTPPSHPPIHPLPGPPFAGSTGPLSGPILSLLFQRAEQHPPLLIHSQIESASIWPFYVPQSAADLV